MPLSKSASNLVCEKMDDEVIKSSYIKSFNPIIEFINDHKHLREEGVIEQWFDFYVYLHRE